VIAATVLCPGCGGSGDRPELGSVHGTITMDGKPFGKVVVVFSPAEGRPSTGVTDDEGRYELQYLNDAKGAKIGAHTVGFAPQEGIAPAFPIPRSYALGSSSAPKVEVEEGANELDFDLASQ